MARRVYTLAKEIEVNSKAIVAKCQAEGLADTVKNHMSTLSAGLEATIREWFSEVSDSGTAVEVGKKVDVAAAKRKAQKKRKKRKTKAEEDQALAPAVAVIESPAAPISPVESPEQEQALAKAEPVAVEAKTVEAPAKV